MSAPAEIEAREPDVPPDEPSRLDLSPRAADRADRDHRAERRQPRERRREELAADRVEDDVRLEILRQLVVDVGLLGAERATGVELLRGADGRDDARTEGARDLDRRRADAARRSVDEHGHAGPHAHLPRERDVRREEREQERRALGERRVIGQRHGERAIDGRLLRVAPAGGRERHHARPVGELARDLGAEHSGKLRHQRVRAVADEHIGEVDPGRAD